VNVFDRVEAWYDRQIAAGRKRSKLFNHGWAAKERFEEALGGRLAAAISYYGFFAAFSLAVLAYSILGRVLGGPTSGFVGTVDSYLNSWLALVRATASQVGTEQITALSAIGLGLTGVAWVDALRSSIRAIWLLEEHPGHWLTRRLVDLGMLAVLGVLLALSLATAGATHALLDWLAPGIGEAGDAVLLASQPALQFLVNLVLGAAMMTVVPRLRLGLRRLIPPALLVSVGIQVLNTVGRYYIGQLEQRPAYQLVSTTVGLLVYLYLLNQLILFGAALAATASRGTAVDLAAAPNRRFIPR
jgi:membrane protein